ncbi:MAG: protein translocase subunit SecD, partial [Candidatus Puniceispirillaceae bacterium]
MLQFESWKKLVVILITVLGIVYAAPNVMPGDDDIAGGVLPGQKINLGLDLQGGSHLLLRVDMDVVAQERLEGVAETIRQDFRAKKIRFSGLDVSDDAVRVTLRKADDSEDATQIFRGFGRDFDVIDESPDYRISFNEIGLTTLQTLTIEQSMEIIRRRIDPDGTKEPVIQRQGADRILVQLPGVDDPEEIKRLLGRTAKLTFQLVDTTMSAQEAMDRGRTPSGSVLLPSDSDDGQFYVVEKRVMV